MQRSHSEPDEGVNGGILHRLRHGHWRRPATKENQPSPGAAWTIRAGAVALLLLSAVVTGLGWWLWGRGPEVKLVLPQRGDAAEVVYATGIVEPTHWAKVTALQRKRIIELCECEGRAVRKGEVLARLDDLEERALLTELEARLARVREDATRLKTLLDRNATSRSTYEEKRTQMSESEARVTAQRDRVNDLLLRSPMDGIVLRRDGEVGEIAGTGANDVLLWIGQPKPLRVVAEVNEDDIGRVKEGQTVLLRHEGHGGSPLTATVGNITPKGDPQTKTFRVYLSLPDDTPLKIGMSVEANVVVSEVKGALLLPAEALVGQTVQVVENGRAVRKVVEAGIRGTSRVEIRSGVSAGQSVISPFRAELANGTRVRATRTGAR